MAHNPDSKPNPEPAPLKTRAAAGFSRFADAYDLYLVDQWGVLHDGQTAFPEAAECLRQLRERGKQVVILSNSGRGVDENVRRLAAMGIGPAGYSRLITSGALARECLESRRAPFPPELGTRCLLLAGDGSTLLDGLPIQPVASAAEADFVLLAGTDDDVNLADYDRLLAPALARGVPLVCVNPDLVRFSPRGLTFSAGEVARRYGQSGGPVAYIGKPDPLIYAHCRTLLPGFDPARTLAVGDSLVHDVAGGAGAGFASAFIVDGVHREAFAGAATDVERLARLVPLVETFGAAPDWMVERFRW